MKHATQLPWGRMLGVFSIGLTATIAFAQSLQVIELKHRTAQEIIPVLQPLVASGGALSGQDYKLFVRTDSANLDELRRAVAQLDREARQLRVSVRSASEQQIEQERIEVSGTLSTQGSSATIRGGTASTQRSVNGVSNVLVLEGNSASIATGSSVPLVTAVAGGGGQRPWIAAQTEYRDLTSGFMVTPRVSGEQVILDVSQQAEGMRSGTIESQRLQTQMSGKLGEWIGLGGIAESASTTQRGSGSRQYSTRSDDRTIWIKVEAVQ